MFVSTFPDSGPFSNHWSVPITTSGERPRCIIVHDKNPSVADHLPNLDHEWEILAQVPLMAGESSKNLETLVQLWDAFNLAQADRETHIICVGGGSLCDLVGFAAGTYHRGLPVVFAPTTALAMVDAAIGGKNGINWRGAKNQLGMLHHPKQIVIEYRWLETLGQVERLSGWIEMAKHAFTESREVAEAFLTETEPTLDAFSRWIPRAASYKWNIVNEDPEELGLRKVLNFGHTVGHALEALGTTPETHLPHGIAVAWGIETALRMSVSLRGMEREEARRAAERLRHWLHPTAAPGWEAERVWPWMLKDKKNKGGQVLEVLLDAWGKPVWDCAITFPEFERAWEATRASEHWT